MSGQQIADELKISRTAVFKHIKALEKIGFVVESVPKQGYRLIKLSEKLHPLVIDSCLETNLIGKPILHFDELVSTINQVMLSADTDREGLVVVAEEQSRGRGRFGRQWSSPKGGIWASVLLKPNVAPTQAAHLNVIASLAIAEAIEQQCSLRSLIKWPNDIVLGDKKVAGILTEMAAELDRINYAILSFGIDVNNSISDELSAIATSIKNESGFKVDRVALFCLILKKLEDYYISWLKNGFDQILEKWKSRCVTLGKKVEVKGLNEILKGEAVGVDENAQLILMTKNGKRTLSAGEVSILQA